MIIENSKTYNASEVENIFFRPTFCGKSAESLGIRILYNMPTPTKVPLFRHNNDILKEFSSGWQGGFSAEFQEREVPLTKLKAESSYSAENYFATIYEWICNSADVNLSDLSGSDLEKAETELFRSSLADSIYANTWFGDVDGVISNHVGFSGFLCNIIKYVEEGELFVPVTLYPDAQESTIEEILRTTWVSASDELRSLASDGQLAFFVSSDIYDAYQFYLDDKGVSSAYNDTLNGRPVLSYHGIPMIEIPSKLYSINKARSFCILTDRRNLVLALNTADSPEKEIRMWYNPDEMENRQRVVFLAGTLILNPELMSGYIYNAKLTLQ